MPKMKTRSLAKKRFSKTATGKIKRSKAFRRHLLAKKNRKKKQDLRKTGYVHATDIKQLQRMLPY